VTASTLNVATASFTAEVIGSWGVTIVAGETKAQWIASVDRTFSAVDDEPRIDIGIGRGWKLSPITGWDMPRPAAWAASVREYQHDVHIPTWRKADGTLSGWDLTDADGNLVQYDERVDGGALAGRFTCLRTWSNGPAGAFVALSLTRATEGSLLSRTHNMAVVDVAQTVTQIETENAIGQVLVLNSDGTAKTDSLKKIEERVNSALQLALLQDAIGEGQRASSAVWTADPTCILNVPGAELLGTLALMINGTLEKISTRVRVLTGG
jgi:hypothetical protein